MPSNVIIAPSEPEDERPEIKFRRETYDEASHHIAVESGFKTRFKLLLALLGQPRPEY